MKSSLRILLPSLVIFIYILIDSMFPESKNIILGIYLLFPTVFIMQGIVCSNSKIFMMIGFLLSSLAIIIPISLWYNMGSMITPVIIYIIFGILPSFFIKQINK
jgi:hypothetical protein